MTVPQNALCYQAYLLRCWEERSDLPDGRVIWRFSLEDPHTGQRRGFATFDALMAVLRDELADCDWSPQAETE